MALPVGCVVLEIGLHIFWYGRAVCDDWSVLDTMCCVQNVLCIGTALPGVLFVLVVLCLCVYMLSLQLFTECQLYILYFSR